MPEGNERVIVTLPTEVVRDIDRLERDRSKFVLEAVRNELERRWREELLPSLRPDAEAQQVAEAGFGEWAASQFAEEIAELVDLNTGKPVRGVVGEGWVEAQE